MNLTPYPLSLTQGEGSKVITAVDYDTIKSWGEVKGVIMRQLMFTLLIFCFTVIGFCSAFSQPAVSVDAKPSEINGCYLGVFREGAPQNMGFITSFEKTFSKKPAMVMWYIDYSSDFPARECNKLAEYGAVPHIVWEPWIWGEEERIKLDNIISGEWDKYIEKWASDAKKFGKTIFVRWGHEFNIEKYSWGIGNNGKKPEKYVKAYRHVHDIFKNAGANNIKWIWCMNNYPNPDEAWNDWKLAYPGDGYVDWIGIDGYNWGTSQTWSGWQSFKDLFRDQVRRISKNYPSKPVMIAEFGCAEEGGDKAAWVKEIPPTLKVGMKQVKAIVLFDVNKECDWRSTSCQRTEDAYKLILKDPYFISSPQGIENISVKPIAAERKVVIAKKAGKVIKIDGNFAPFSSATPIKMESDIFFKEGTSWKSPKDLSANIYLMWDEANFYVYAKITDSYPLVNSKTNGDIWDGDAIEILIPNYQIGLGTGDGRANKPIIWIWQKRRSPVGGEIYVSKTLNPTGYVMEAKIPWKELGGIAPKAGNTIGFDIAVDDADETWQRKAQLIWNGDYLFYKDPDVWGQMKFEN